MLEAYLQVLEEGYYEIDISFEGLANDNVWKRPSDRLLSIGEIAGHIAYWEAVKFAGEGGKPEPDLSKCTVSSLLIDRRFSYYTTTITTSPTEQHRAVTADQVRSELLRVHNQSLAHFKARNPDLDSCPPGWSPKWSYRAFLTYAAFHVAYHTGQIYSARFLLGDVPPDN
jgi:hypothetical protein